jgi:hypothetical protein
MRVTLSGEKIAELEPLRIHLVSRRLKLRAVQLHRDQRQFVAIQNQRRARICPSPCPHRKTRRHHGRLRVELEDKIDLLDRVGGGAIILDPEDLAGVLAHGDQLFRLGPRLAHYTMSNAVFTRGRASTKLTADTSVYPLS